MERIAILLLTIAVLIPCHQSIAAEAYDPTPEYYETSVFAIGKCAVGLVCVQPPQTTWTKVMEEDVLVIVQESLEMFENLSNVCIHFLQPDVHSKISTRYDPAKTLTDEMWVSEVMSNIGFEGSSYREKVYNYTDYLRQTLKSDWAIIIFMVLTPYFGNTGNNNGAYAWLGGPCVSCSYSYNGSRLLLVHEMAHVFWATDEYNHETEYSGYLYAADNESAKCLMNSCAYIDFCTASREQLGWRDSDGDGIQDIVDNEIWTSLDQFWPNPTMNVILRYTGISFVKPYPTSHPGFRDITTTKVANVQFRIDNRTWFNATSTDGSFDEAVEEFFFVTPELDPGQHTIEVRSINSVGNIDESHAKDTVTIIEGGESALPVANFTYHTDNENITVGDLVLFDASSSSSSNSSITLYRWNFGDDNITSTNDPYVTHVYDLPGTYKVILNVLNSNGLTDETDSSITIFSLSDINKDTVVNILDIASVANAFNSTPNSPRWKPEADLNIDKVINIMDVTRVAIDFGKVF